MWMLYFLLCVPFIISIIWWFSCYKCPKCGSRNTYFTSEHNSNLYYGSWDTDYIACKNCDSVSVREDYGEWRTSSAYYGYDDFIKKYQ